jgi:hypothetical protein
VPQNAIPGRYARLDLSADGIDFVPLTELVDVRLSINVGELETTTHDSNGRRTYIPGLTDFEMSVSAQHVEGCPAQNLVHETVDSLTQVFFRYRLQTVAGRREWQGRAFVRTGSLAGPLDEAAKLDVQMRCSGVHAVRQPEPAEPVLVEPPPFISVAPSWYLDVSAAAGGIAPDVIGGRDATYQGLVFGDDGPGGLPSYLSNNSTGAGRSLMGVSNATLGTLMKNANGRWWISWWVMIPALYTPAYYTIMVEWSAVNGAPFFLAAGYHDPTSWRSVGYWSANGTDYVGTAQPYMKWTNYQIGCRAKAGDPTTDEFVKYMDGVMLGTITERVLNNTQLNRGDARVGLSSRDPDNGGIWLGAEPAIWDGYGCSEADVAAVYARGLAGIRLDA